MARCIRIAKRAQGGYELSEETMGYCWQTLLLLNLLPGIGGGTCFAAAQLLTPEDVAREFDQRSWRHEHGLPDNRVWAVLQTSDGYIWVGTQFGLARFDGLVFSVFDHINTPELENDDCRSLAEDSEGNLWIATQDAVICKSGNRFTRFDNEAGLSIGAHPLICRSREGGVWVAGIASLDRICDGRIIKWSEEPASALAQAIVTTLDEDTAGSVWMGTLEGLYRFNVRNRTFERIGQNTWFGRLPVFGICHSPSGKEWALYAERMLPPGQGAPKTWLVCVSEDRWGTSPDKSEADPRAGLGSFLTSDRTGALWSTAVVGGIYRWKEGRIQFLRFPPGGAGDDALCAYEDREGGMWIGLDQAGLQRWTPRKFANYAVAEGLPGDNVWSICQARDGSVWIGTDGGVSRFSGGRFKTCSPERGSAPQDVRALAEDAQGTIWVGTARSLECIRDGKITNANLPGDWVESKVRVLLPGREGAIWVGTARGLTRLRGAERTKYTKAQGLGSDDVRALLESRTGALWVGTSRGGLSSLRDGRITTLTRADGLSSDCIWALHEDSEGVLWVGTENGLNRLDHGRITCFGTPQGLPTKMVNCILEDGFGRLWIGHDYGIYWIWKRQLDELAAGKRAHVVAVRYDESDGLLSVENNGQKSNPAACRTRDGRLWFSTTRGVAVIDPARAALDEIAPAVVVEEIRANGRLLFSNRPEDASGSQFEVGAWEEKTPIRLPPGGARVFTFHYTASAYVAAEKTRFRYRLVGLDDHWIDAGSRRELHFADLRPRSYRLELSACNHHGVWQKQSTAVAFSVAPFFYRTWWFYMGSGSLLAMLLALATGWRIREVRKIARLDASML